ncbi:DJ-1/PfpI family protein [Paenibacillus sp. GSMTC-2017]|uniref:DJ-1/PfpI family protein n=1 Tax=Paenibacillus sp. GSMTC-2017 TaxID=2794350 RepID=UPI0018D89C96|nr:DJ-1/PfpI family protein [Paenibacillus sp. GSMTC-2017]MBH5317525.1 DJ-1/PfpI family protein [Paenibacillus sp. GSMTC-2017]
MAQLNENAALLLYPGMTALDLIGPQYVFSTIIGMNVHLAAKSKEPILTDTGVSILPTMTLQECPNELTVLFVPGGTEGTLAAIEDHETLAFVADRGARAQYVTSVCTGSLVLGAAGLLRGYKATSHWISRDLLELVGAEPINERVVFDRNRVTGGGVTAGIDFALSLAGKLRGDEYAQTIQLLAEYAPRPPYQSGTPEEAEPAITKKLIDMTAPFLQKAHSVLLGASL